MIHARTLGRRERKPQLEDYMPKIKRRPQTWQEQLTLVEMLNAGFGGEDLRRVKRNR
jgi:competence CoiA-like predicted nuclease